MKGELKTPTGRKRSSGRSVVEALDADRQAGQRASYLFALVQEGRSLSADSDLAGPDFRGRRPL